MLKNKSGKVVSFQIKNFSDHIFFVIIWKFSTQNFKAQWIHPVLSVLYTKLSALNR